MPEAPLLLQAEYEVRDAGLEILDTFRTFIFTYPYELLSKAKY